MSDRIAHITIATRDVEKTVRFFEQVFGWRRIAAPANVEPRLRVAWLDMGGSGGGQEVHVLLDERFEPSPFEGEYGRHIALFVGGRRIPDLKRRLAEHGAELVPPIRPTPFARFFFRDPNGYAFEVIDEDQYAPER
jgi:catechol 2,3-dioxygenase-like lactoylglutathione lyase family enzyme